MLTTSTWNLMQKIDFVWVWVCTRKSFTKLWFYETRLPTFSDHQVVCQCLNAYQNIELKLKLDNNAKLNRYRLAVYAYVFWLTIAAVSVPARIRSRVAVPVIWKRRLFARKNLRDFVRERSRSDGARTVLSYGIKVSVHIAWIGWARLIRL